MTNMRVMVIGLLAIFAGTPAWSGSMVNVTCEGEVVGAQVFVNDKLVGECLSEIYAPVPAGQVQLRIRKMTDSEHERLFYKELQVIDGVPQIVDEIVLSPPQLTAEAIRNREVAEAAKQLQAAEAGDIAAMKKIADYFAKGYGVELDPDKAQEWRVKADATEAGNQLRAAEDGDLQAMKKIADYYTTGFGVEQDMTKAQDWRNKIAAAEKLEWERKEAQRLQQEVEKTKQIERKANSGDPEAMKELASRYSQGLGAPKDYLQAQIWREKANEVYAQKERQAKLEKQRSEVTARLTEAQVKLNEVKFINALEGADRQMRRNRNNPIAQTVIFAVSSPIATVMDVIATPTHGTDYSQKKRVLDDAKKELERISSWGNPNSMIARAANNTVQISMDSSLLAKIDH